MPQNKSGLIKCLCPIYFHCDLCQYRVYLKENEQLKSIKIKKMYCPVAMLDYRGSLRQFFGKKEK